MCSPLYPLVHDEKELKSSLGKRSKKYIEKSIKGKTKKILKQKAELEAEDGWRILRRNVASFRLAKDKPLDEVLEDQVWCIFAKCGFPELSLGREFKVSVGSNLPPRQIDIFAKGDETAVFVECTTTEIPKKKPMTSLIEKISSIGKPATASINEQFGAKPKLKIKWIIATKNIEWSQPDLDRAAAENIVVLRDFELDYFTRLTNLYKRGATYQLLAHIFSGEQIKGLDISVPATRGKMGNRIFYNFLIKPNDLLKIAYVSHKAIKDIEDLDTYQRMLVPKRLKDIAKYVESGGQFPTNIVVNLKSGVKFDRKETIGDSAFGILRLPDKYASAWIIDGQHRLYGYAQSETAKIPSDKTTLPVLAYENLSPSDEANLFVDINCEQVRVTKNLLVEIYANLRWDSDVHEERMDALRSRVVMALEQKPTSPIKERVVTTNKHKTNYRCLTLTSFTDGLKQNKFFGEERGGNIIPGLLTDSNSKDLSKTMKKGTDILSGFMGFYAEAMPTHWSLGDSPGGFLCTNNGIRSLLRVLKEILNHLVFVHYISVDTFTADELLPLIKEHNDPVVDHFRQASSEEISIFRSRQALKGVTQNARQMMTFINSTHKDFLPNGLPEYLSTIDKEGTKDARIMIDDISRRLFETTISVLKEKYPEREDWWYEGIPETIRTNCSDLQEVDKGRKEKIQYIYMIDYRTIAAKNWDVLEEHFAFGSDRGKDKQTKWLIDLNEVRKITHHAEKWPATKDQVTYVREIYNKVIDKFPE